MFVRLNQSDFGNVQNVLAGLFDLDAKQTLAEVEYFECDKAFLKKREESAGRAAQVMATLASLPGVEAEETGEGGYWFRHTKVGRELALKMYDLLTPMIYEIEAFIRAEIAMGCGLESERALVLLRSKLVHALKLVGPALPIDTRQLLPEETFFPLPGALELRVLVPEIAGTLRAMHQSMAKFADASSSDLVKLSCIRADASSLRADADSWELWKSDAVAYWRLPAGRLVQDTYMHFTAFHAAVKKARGGLKSGIAENDHPETAQSIIMMDQRLTRIMAMLPDL
jgi:hypothetical protein